MVIGTPSDDDLRLGRLLRAIRRRGGLTQEALARAAQVPVRSLISAEAGEIGRLELDRARRLFAAAGGRARLTAWYNGALADRLLDERHASIGEAAVTLLKFRRWQMAVEVTFSEFGERGSIDIFAAYPALRAVGVFEIKSDIGSLEEMNRVLDMKVRLAPKLAVARFGFRPAVVGRVLVLPRDMTIRRVIERHAETIRAIYPADSRAVRTWLRNPAQPVAGIWFVSGLRNRKMICG